MIREIGLIYPAITSIYLIIVFFLNYNYSIDKHLNYPELINSFLLQQLERDKKTISGGTVHHNFDRLLRIWPDAKFIHICRDGRDVARSTIPMGWAGNLFTGVGYWIREELLWQKFSPQLAPEQKLTVHYEALIRQSDEVLTQICTFIGVPFDKAIYDYAQHSTYSLPDPHLTEQWRRKLSNYEIQLAESRISIMLEERGYQLSGLPLLKNHTLVTLAYGSVRSLGKALVSSSPLSFQIVFRRCILAPLTIQRLAKKRTVENKRGSPKTL